MLVLQANHEQEATFNRLIQTMGEQIVWNGRFIIRDNELILEGTVRSLVFQFDTKKVLTDLIDIPVKEDQVLDISGHPTLKDLINMVLYAFGKWGTLRGLRVEQDYPQLNQLFGRILGTFYIEPSFRKENFRFYKVGVRITYEEVLQTVLEYEKKQEADPNAESQGLWHRLIWKNRERVFRKAETTLLERVEDRIGNNFYLVGYQCPKCSQKLHMAVYPDGKEVRIDTEEKGVYLARAYTCSSCNCFYTPRPDRLISEGLVYEMNFDDDKAAYEDYLELLGRNAERAANYKYNEYEAVRKLRLEREARGAAGQGNDPDQLNSPQDALRQMEDFGRRFSSLPDQVFQRFAHRVEEGFYPDAAVKKYEKKILKEVRERQKKEALEKGQEQAGHGADAQKKETGGISGKNRMSGVNDEMALDEMGQAQHTGWNGASHPVNDEMALDDAGQAQHRLLDDAGQAQHRILDHKGHTQHRIPDEKGQTRQMESDDTGQARHTVFDDTGRRAGNIRSGSQLRAGRGDAGSTMQSRTDTMYAGGTAQERYPDHMQTDGPGQQHTDAVSQGALEHGAAVHQQNRQGGDTLQKSPAEERIEKYYIRTGMLERLSDRQKKELKKQIQNDAAISGNEKKELLGRIEEAEYKDIADALAQKAEKSRNKNYVQLRRMIEEEEGGDYPDGIKGPYLEKLRRMQQQRGEEEVRQIIARMPERMDRAGFRKLQKKLEAYEGVDLSPYEETLRKKREAAEKQEIAGMVKRSRKVSRGDFVGLMRRLEEQDFADENIAPYMDKIKEKVQALDEERLDELLDQAGQIDFNAAAAVYEQIDAENFLPELKSSALEMLSKRLEKIRTDECELLVKKLQEEMQDTIRENDRHHFYPARKVMMHTAEPGETSAIDAALASYAGDRSMFEYPIFSVDTSRSRNGREGMILTPENLFYSTKMHSYGIPVSDIASIEASTGFLNRRLTLEETNGATHKLPYAVKTGEMENWAGILEDFIHYLQEKPVSRKLKYLARETHDTICCYRCGYVYRDRDVCPECGYKKNR